MDFKQAIIENAWGGFSVDYGLLHLQLATPFAVMIVLFIMISVSYTHLTLPTKA